MTPCDSIGQLLTPWVDGELAPRDEQRVVQHLADCPSCAEEADSLRRAVAWQTPALATHMRATPVDVEAMRIALRPQINAARRDEERKARRSWVWWIRPLAMATAGLALVLVVASRAGEPESILVSLGIAEPPAEVASHPEMFRYLDVIENLEALEHFEAVQAVRLEDERARLDNVRHG